MGSYLLGLEDSGSRMARLGALLATSGEVRPVAEQVARWQAVDRRGRRRVIERVLDQPRTVAAVGPVSEAAAGGGRRWAHPPRLACPTVADPPRPAQLSGSAPSRHGRSAAGRSEPPRAKARAPIGRPARGQRVMPEATSWKASRRASSRQCRSDRTDRVAGAQLGAEQQRPASWPWPGAWRPTSPVRGRMTRGSLRPAVTRVAGSRPRHVVVGRVGEHVAGVGLGSRGRPIRLTRPR